jgi:hypothetical protein
MKEPAPLLREGATDFERRLLSAALGERPSPRLRAQMRRGIGLTGPLVWAGNVKAMLGTLVGKSVIGAVGLVAAGGLAAAVHHAAAPPADSSPAVSPSAPVEAQQPPLAAAPVLAPPAGAPTTTDTTGSDEAASDAVAGKALPGSDTAGDDTASDHGAAERDDAANGQLREEIRLLDQARGALQRGSAKDARSVLAEYRERFPAGILGREANVLLEQTGIRGTSRAAAKERGTPHRAH